MSRERFEPMYRGQPPWDIPGPQPALVALEEAGEIRGSVLDAGCGTGENALFLASRGHEVWGIDIVPVAIERARAKAREQGLEPRFEVADALELTRLGRQFDTAIDCGLFHTFDDEQRIAYVRSLGAAVRPGGAYHMLCFSDREPPGEGPRRVTQREIRDAFRGGWEVRSIREASFETASGPEMPQFSPGGPRAWLATVLRTGDGRESPPRDRERRGIMLRKRIIEHPTESPETSSEAIDIAAAATVLVTSEAPEHPVDHAFDGSRGPGGTRWIAGEFGEQRLILAFDAPQAIRRVVLEVEEPEVARTQELELAFSTDGGRTYRDVLRQEYNFSPPGTTFEREDWEIRAEAVTHLRLVVRPDKGGKPCRASITSLALR